MRTLLTRRRLSMGFSCLGICLMGVDLLVTGNFFVHVGELMAASLACMILGILIDRQPVRALSVAKARSRSRFDRQGYRGRNGD